MRWKVEKFSRFLYKQLKTVGEMKEDSASSPRQQNQRIPCSHKDTTDFCQTESDNAIV